MYLFSFFFFGNCERSWLIGNGTLICVVQYCKSRASDFVNHSYDHRPKWSPLGPITIMFNWSSSFILPYKALCIFHDLIKSLSLYIHRGPQRPQIAWALRTRAILFCLAIGQSASYLDECTADVWTNYFITFSTQWRFFFLEGFVCWRHERAQ